MISEMISEMISARLPSTENRVGFYGIEASHKLYV